MLAVYYTYSHRSKTLHNILMVGLRLQNHWDVLE